MSEHNSIVVVFWVDRPGPILRRSCGHDRSEMVTQMSSIGRRSWIVRVWNGTQESIVSSTGCYPFVLHLFQMNLSLFNSLHPDYPHHCKKALFFAQILSSPNDHHRFVVSLYSRRGGGVMVVKIRVHINKFYSESKSNLRQLQSFIFILQFCLFVVTTGSVTVLTDGNANIIFSYVGHFSHLAVRDRFW